MNGGEDFLLRPVAEGMCKYESLLDGTLDLADIHMMNEYLSVKAENEARFSDLQADRRRNADNG